MTPTSFAHTLDQLALAKTHTAERLAPALKAAVARTRALTPGSVGDQAVDDLCFGLAQFGAAALDGGDPQAVEDALFAARADSPLDESTFRLAWLALVDQLARTGDKPPFGGTGGAEPWAMSARGRPWPFVDFDDQVAQVAARFGEGLHVVLVRGPGRSSFLAAVRRRLLAAHGPEALVPPVTSAARDDLKGPLTTTLSRANFPDEIKKALPQLSFGEDRVGLLGRAGDAAPVAYLLDDAHIQARSSILGLPLFVEPAPNRRALLVLAGPAGPEDDSALVELLADARDRGILSEITLPALDETRAAALLTAAFGPEAASLAGALTAASADPDPATAWRLAHAWLGDISEGSKPAADAAARLAAGFDLEAALPAHAGARNLLARLALEGDTYFHGFAAGALIGKGEDDIEDLLFDDEYELDGTAVGGCEGAVPTGNTLWAELPDGLHPAFAWADARVAAGLRATLDDEQRKATAGTLRDSLMNGYQPERFYLVADRCWRLDRASAQPRMVEQMILGTQNAQRIEAGFRRMLPVLNAKEPFRLALARLYGSAMEVGQLAAATGQIQLADQAFQAGAAAAQRLGRMAPAGEALARLGEMRLALSLPQPALAAFDLAEKLLAQSGQTRSQARVTLLRAEVAIVQGDLDLALKLLREGMEVLRGLGDKAHLSLGGLRLGRLLYERGDNGAAMLAFEEAVRDADASRDPRPAAAARMARAFVLGESGDLEGSMGLLNAAAQAFQAAGMPAHIVEVAAAGLQRRHGEHKLAEARLRKMAEAFKQAKAAVQWADAWHEVGRCLVDQARFTEAGPILTETLEIRKRARDRFALIRTHEDLAACIRGQGEVGGAFLELSRARRFAERLGLARHLGRIDAELAYLASRVDGVSDQDVNALKVQAEGEVDELEAIWARPPQAPVQSQQVH